MPALDREFLFWTSRGFGVVDVNYRGSSGYGRAYRDKLQGDLGRRRHRGLRRARRRHLAEAGEADGARLAIRGGSAGGYATLCALVFHDDFAAGASYFGVADAEALATDTHKFESRYLDGLIGPYPERADLYRERSPIHFVERLRSPVILFQGLEDEIVPPNQAETMVAALAANGVPHAYLAFEGEQHGFRKRGDEHPLPRSRALLLRPHPRLRAGRRARAGRDRRPRLSRTAPLGAGRAARLRDARCGSASALTAAAFAWPGLRRAAAFFALLALFSARLFSPIFWRSLFSPLVLSRRFFR